MAGDWIPMGVGLPKRREVVAIAAATGWSRYEVCGRLLEFWGWVQEESVDGELPGVTLGDLPVMFVGSEPLWPAMVDVGWLETTDTGLRIPNADHWITKGAKKRVLSARRQRQFRETYADPWETRAVNKAARPLVAEAHRLVSSALRRGEIKRLPCEVCNNPDSDAHHDDYLKPLDVRWLCPKHHALEGRGSNAGVTQVELLSCDQRREEDRTEEIENSLLVQNSLAVYLRDKILANKRDAKVPKDLTQWADVIRLMIEQDGRDPKAIAQVIRFAQSDTFWCANILSADKLRKKFDTLELQLRRQNGRRGTRRNPAAGTGGSTDDSTTDKWAADRALAVGK